MMRIKHSYKNTTGSIEDRVADLMEKMTLEEKIGQMIQLDGSHDPELWVKQRNIGSYLNLDSNQCRSIQNMALSETRLGIPILFGIDAIHGHGFGHEKATIFPTQLALSCSWNPTLIQKVAEITAKEVIQTGHHWTFSPVLCVARDPRWGRTNETFGEDPYLTGILAAATIRGYQGVNLSDPNSILACPKHFVAYGESVGGRDSGEVMISRRTLKSLFLPPFRRVIQEAHAGSIMVAYQSIDGIPCSANTWLLQDVLKSEWNFKGFTLTDWRNIDWMHQLQRIVPTQEEAIELGLRAGNDMIMSTPEFYDHILDCVSKNKIDISLINEAVSRILKIKFELGLFDEKAIRTSPPSSEVIGCLTHRQVALDAALESIVLLKNEKDILPLDDEIGKVAVIGPNADYWIAQLGDWSFKTGNMTSDHNVFQTQEHKNSTITLLEGIKTRLLGKSEVYYAKGCHIQDPEIENISEAIAIARNADAIIVAIGDTHSLNGERKDRATLTLSGNQQKLLQELKLTQKPLIAVLINGRPLEISWLMNNVDAILEAFNPGCEGGNALAQIIFGDYNPSGKLSISFPKSVGQIPVYYNQYPGWHGGRYVDLDNNYKDGGVAIPLLPFGYGLSYTKFLISNLHLSAKEISEGETLIISVDIQNVGRMKGIETIQLYINDLYSSVTTPVKELKSFKRIHLNPNQSESVEFYLTADDLTLILPNLQVTTEPGIFQVFVGNSSRNEDLLRSEFYFIKRTL